MDTFSAGKRHVKYDVVNKIHDVTRTANPFPYTVKFMFVGVENNKTQQIRR